MNVLISSGFRWWNAEAAYAAMLAMLLREAGHGAHVIAPPGSRNAEELARRGLEPLGAFWPGGLNPLRWPTDMAWLLRFLRRERIDVVDVFRPAEFPLMAWAARRVPGVRLIRTRGGAQPERASWLYRKLYGDWCDAVIASCELIRARLQARLRVPTEKLRTIYYPVEASPLPTGAEREAARTHLLRQLQLEPGRLLLAVVGRIAPEKGHQPLLEALQTVVRALPRAVLLIVNKADPGEAPHRAGLEQAIAERGLEPWVRWLGFRSDVRELMGACDLGVIPSVASEMNCRVAVEFFAAGTPVVAFPTGALPEVVEHGISGWVTATHSPPDLAEALIRLLGDEALRTRLGQVARQQAERRFSPRLFLEQTLEVFAGPRGQE